MMASPGEEICNGSATVESENNTELFCSPCQSDGKRLTAVGYCETCKESLCGRCFDCHTVPVPMRNHHVFKREETVMEHGINDEENKCPEHEGEPILYHCHIHSFLGCHTCFFQHQKTCRDAKYIPDISKTIASSDEFKEFMTKLNYTVKTSKNVEDECKRNITLVETCHTDAVAEIKAFKLELLEAFDQLERDLSRNAEIFKQNENSKLNHVVDKCLQIQADIQTVATEIEFLQSKNRNCDLYISMVKSRNKVLSLEVELNAAKGLSIPKLFNFEANSEIHETFKSPFGLGKLRSRSDIGKTEHIKDINVKLQDDNYRCCITGSVTIPEHKLVIADNYNNSVKIIDTKQLKVSSALTLPSDPWSLAKVNDNTVAATLPTAKKIVFIKTEPELCIDAEIEVDGTCHGIAYSDRKLVVSFNDPQKVELMDVKGSVQRRIQTDGDGRALFNYPSYIAINPERSLIYVSNYYGHNVLCLRFDGTTVASYKNNELTKPYQVIVDSSGEVYVCCYGSCNVHQLAQDCTKIKVLLVNTDGYPCTLSYDENEGKLYIGQWKNNNVSVYQQPYEYSRTSDNRTLPDREKCPV